MREWHCKNCNTIFPGPPVASYVDYASKMKRKLTPAEIIHCVRLAIKEKERLENGMSHQPMIDPFTAQVLLTEAREMISYPHTPTAPIELIARIDKFLQAEPVVDGMHHHASCKPGDIVLQWVCEQCGSRTSAESVCQVMPTLSKRIQVAQIRAAENEVVQWLEEHGL